MSLSRDVDGLDGAEEIDVERSRLAAKVHRALRKCRAVLRPRDALELVRGLLDPEALVKRLPEECRIARLVAGGVQQASGYDLRGGLRFRKATPRDQRAPVHLGSGVFSISSWRRRSRRCPADELAPCSLPARRGAVRRAAMRGTEAVEVGTTLKSVRLYSNSTWPTWVLLLLIVLCTGIDLDLVRTRSIIVPFANAV